MRKTRLTNEPRAPARHRLFLGLIAAAVAGAALGQDASDYSRIVAFGDVHGAYAELHALLERVDVIDADGNWVGGDTHLISVGDLLDRGSDSRAVLDLLMRLQDTAPAAGGRVDVVAGNHEHMNLIGDLRYVSAGEFAAFADDETVAMRDAAFNRWAQAREDPAAADRSRFDALYPAGYFAHRTAFSPEGRYGSWLLDLPAILVADGTAFVHGGLPQLVAENSVGQLNSQLHEEILQYESLRSSLAARGALPPIDMSNDFALAQQALEGDRDDLKVDLASFLDLTRRGIASDAGPLWYRGSVYCKPVFEGATLDDALAALGVNRVVVGHTPTDNRRVQVHYNGKLIRLDTGMLASYYHGMSAALIFDTEGVKVQYADAANPVPLDLSRHEVAYGRTSEELEHALASAAIVSMSGDARESGILELDLDGTRIRARFVAFRHDGGNELAAARVDDLIGTDSVAPTAVRQIDGETVAVQLVYPDEVTETQRLEQSLPFASWCPVEPQLQLMYVLDLLIGNAGRTRDNILFIDDLAELVLTGHTQAFSTQQTMPAGFDLSQLDMPPAVADGLAALDENRLNAVLGDVLNRRQIRALLSRRDALLTGR